MAEIMNPETGEITETGNSLAAFDSKIAVELAKAEIDQQIATAKQYPRVVSRVSSNILSLATIDQGAAEEALYALPRGGKPIVGPSIRLAEIVGGQWGNNRVAARVIDVNRTEKYVEAEGIFHDLETNAAVKATVRRRIVDKRGQLFNDDMIIVTGNAACSIARRNAIFAGVPKAVWRRAYEAAEMAVKGDIKTLSERRDGAIKAFAAYGVKPEQIFAALGVAGLDDVTLEHIPALTGMYQAIKNGEATVEQMFDPRQIGSGHKMIANALDDGPAPTKGKGPRGHSRQSAESDHLENENGEVTKSRDEAPAAAKEADKAPAATPDKAEPANAASRPAAGHDDIDETPAYKAGRQARRDGKPRQPDPAYPDEEAEAEEDWLVGWDEQDAESSKG